MSPNTKQPELILPHCVGAYACFGPVTENQDLCAIARTTLDLLNYPYTPDLLAEAIQTIREKYPNCGMQSYLDTVIATLQEKIDKYDKK